MEGGFVYYIGISPTLLPLFLHFMKKIYRIVIDQNIVNEFNSKYFLDHPRAKNKAIKAPKHPSLNEYLGMTSVAQNTLKTKWEELIEYVLTTLHLKDIHIEKCRIDYITYFKVDRRHDLDNISPKFIFDGLVKAGFLADDDYKHVVSLTTKCDIDKYNPRIELLVEVLE